MTLQVINPTAGWGGKNVNTEVVTAVRELQGLKRAVVAGAAAATDITVAGLGATDTLASVTVIDFTGAAVSLPTDFTIDGAGKIKSATTVSTGKFLIVEWFAKPASQALSALQDIETISAITLGATTVLTLGSLPIGVAVGVQIGVQGLTGADAALVNGLQTVSAIDSVDTPPTVTIAVNTTGKTITVASGSMLGLAVANA